MQHEATLITLNRLTAQVETETIALGFGALPDPASAAYLKLANRIAEWETRVEAIGKSINSSQGLLDVSYRSAMRGPGGYSARQSYASRSRNLDTLRGAAAGLALAIVALKARLDGPQNEGHATLKALSHALEQIIEGVEPGKDVTKHELTHLVQQGADNGPPVGLGSPTGILMLVVVLLATLRKSRGK